MRSLLLIAALMVATPAEGREVRNWQVSCGPMQEAFAVLEGKYGERRKAFGVTQVGIVNWWLNEETGTWTVSVAGDDGILCIFLTGDSGDMTPDAPALTIEEEGDL